MARRRMIDPNIWESEDFSSLSVMERLLFIGMFSLADDEGRGIASPKYLKAQIFRYDDISIEQIDEGICHIEQTMSVKMYKAEGKWYYQLLHWKEWQTIQKPKPSKIPSPNTSTVPVQYEYSTNTVPVQEGYNVSEVNISEVNKNISEVKSSEVTLTDITEYGWTKGIPSHVCEKFFEYNSERGWMFKGKPMENWKTALEAWNRKEKTLTNHNYAEHDLTDIKVNMVDLDAED